MNGYPPFVDQTSCPTDSVGSTRARHPSFEAAYPSTQGSDESSDIPEVIFQIYSDFG